MNDITQRQSRFLAYFQGAALALVGLAFFAQPLMKFAHPGALFLAGLMIAMGVVVSYFQYALLWNGKRIDLLGTGLLVGGLFVLGVGAVQAYQVSRANDETCLAIEADIRSAKPRIADGPAKFQALMCRPTMGGIRIR